MDVDIESIKKSLKNCISSEEELKVASRSTSNIELFQNPSSFS